MLCACILACSLRNDLVLLHLNVFVWVLDAHLVLSPDGIHKSLPFVQDLSERFLGLLIQLRLVRHLLFLDDQWVLLQDDVLLQVVLLALQHVWDHVLVAVGGPSDAIPLQHVLWVSQCCVCHVLLRLQCHEVLFEQETLCKFVVIVRLHGFGGRASHTRLVQCGVELVLC